MYKFIFLSLYVNLNCSDSEMYFNQIVFLCTDHQFIPAFFMLKSLIGFFFQFK